jgi:hypothetical protein
MVLTQIGARKLILGLIYRVSTLQFIQLNRLSFYI